MRGGTKVRMWSGKGRIKQNLSMSKNEREEVEVSSYKNAAQSVMKLQIMKYKKEHYLSLEVISKPESLS